MAGQDRNAGWGGGQRAQGSVGPGHPPRDSSSPLHGSESGDSGHVTGTTYLAAPEWQLGRPMRGRVQAPSL